MKTEKQAETEQLASSEHENAPREARITADDESSENATLSEDVSCREEKPQDEADAAANETFGAEKTDASECPLEAEPVETPSEIGLPILNHTEAQSEANFCKKCGAILEKDAIFCPKCGTAVSPSQAVSNKNRSNKKLLGAIGAAAVVVVAVICFMAFRPIPIDTLSITQADTEAYVGYPSNPIKTTYTPTDARQTKIAWSSSDESIATVDSDGIVNAMATGTATITAQAESGVTATCEVQCYAIPNFKQIVKDKCKGNSKYCTVAPDGLSLEIDTNPTDSKADITQLMCSIEADPYVQAANKALGLPDSLWSSMNTTSALQGKQSKTYGIIEVTWTYHPDKGLDVIYENTSGKAPKQDETA